MILAGVDLLVTPGDLRVGVDVALEDGRVAAIAPAAASHPGGADVLDGRGLLAVPGLVNAHTHSPENPMRGLGDGLALEPWLARLMGESGPYSGEDHYWCALATAAELLLCGCTSVVDHVGMTPLRPEGFDGVMRAYRDAGIRGGMAPLFSDHDATADLARSLGVVGVDGPLIPQMAPALPTREAIALTDDAVARWHGAEGGRLHLLTGASGIQWASEELLVGMADLARRRGTTMQLHVLETRVQDAACRARFGGGSGVRVLSEWGVLGPEVSMAHGVWLDVDDLDLIAAAGGVVVHNPAANTRLRSGRARVRELLDRGVAVGVGTDGAASSDDQQMWFAMRLATLIHRGPDEEHVSSGDALAMATSLGARALGVDGLGTLAVGAPADIALLDRASFGLAGARDLEAALVLSETGGSVRHVVVAGELVVRDRVPVRFSLDDVHAAIAEQRERRLREPADPRLPETIARIEALRAALARTRA
ncbi:amidohydrolase family protein [Conexibacter woesei]|uniref:amidohydrolase family protein n=1 Tax=Conexibacter woesei TaxID=191495 RepID=UPI00041C3823|nr:amidohydrolase family protein [Conexibacter woesei]